MIVPNGLPMLKFGLELKNKHAPMDMLHLLSNLLYAKLNVKFENFQNII